MIKSEVGNTACQISELLDSYGELEVKEISHILKHKEEPVFIALGRLTHECKIFFFKEDDGILKICSVVILENEK